MCLRIFKLTSTFQHKSFLAHFTLFFAFLLSIVLQIYYKLLLHNYLSQDSVVINQSSTFAVFVFSHFLFRSTVECVCHNCWTTLFFQIKSFFCFIENVQCTNKSEFCTLKRLLSFSISFFCMCSHFFVLFFV